MIFGVGIDIEDHTRFEKYYKNAESIRNLAFIFTENEFENYKLFNSHLCFAVSFSCKEALYKALNNNDLHGINLREIELIFNDEPTNNNARVFFYGETLKLVKEKNIINPPFFEYSFFGKNIIFETILRCNTKQPTFSPLLR